MTLQEAVAILRAHNEWRRGNNSESWHDPMPYSPAELGMAIDVVCDHIEHPLGMVRERHAKPCWCSKCFEAIEASKKENV